MIPIMGNSGASVAVIRHEGGWVVKKTFPLAETDRMLSQIKKMQESTCPGFFFPSIIEVDREKSFYLMQHIRGEDMVSLTSMSSSRVFLETFERLQVFLEQRCAINPPSQFPIERWEMKLSSTLEAIAIRSPFLLSDAKEAACRLMRLRPGPIPMGQCHGDFSLSNLLVTDSGICLLDPISAPIETPIEDVAKLLMDMDIAWSASRFVGTFDRSKAIIRWKIAASNLRKAMTSSCDPEAIEAMRGLSMIRIVPYCSSNISADILRDGLKGVA